VPTLDPNAGELFEVADTSGQLAVTSRANFIATNALAGDVVVLGIGVPKKLLVFGGIALAAGIAVVWWRRRGRRKRK